MSVASRTLGSGHSSASSVAGRRFWWAATGLLLVLAAAYLGRGFYFGTQPGGDMMLRWTEQQYINHGQNPYDVSFRAHALARGEPAPESGRDAALIPGVKAPWSVDYPPWAYFSGAVFFSANAKVSAFVFGMSNLVALCVVLVWVGYQFRGYPVEKRWFAVAAVAAFAPICTTVGGGNYGVIVLALLVGYLVLEEDHPYLAGLLLGIAQMKPTLAGPFLLVPLVRWQPRVLAASAGYLLVSSLAVGVWVQTSPLEMLGQMLKAASEFVGEGYSLLSIPLAAGVPYTLSVVGTALLVVAVTGVLLWTARRCGPGELFAIACVGARFWSYHLTHSNLILLFFWVFLMQMRELERRKVLFNVTFFALCLTLWVPASLTDFPVVQAAQLLVWCGAFLVYFLTRFCVRAEVRPLPLQPTTV